MGGASLPRKPIATSLADAMSADELPPPPRKASWKRWAIALAGILAIIAVAFLLAPRQPRGTRCAATILWTNVTSVTATVTHGPNHFYYYPSRLSYEWDKLRKKVGIKVKNPVQKQVFSRSPTCDVLWVKITFANKKYRPDHIVAEQIDAKGKPHLCSQVSRPSDATRPVSLEAFNLEGDLQKEQVRTFRIKSGSGQRDLARIELR
jgi:autotransporter translocation and assembly factor TamB